MQSTHPDTFVPVEHRWFGLDKRSLGVVIFVAVVSILMAGVIPLVNEQFHYDRQAEAGDVIKLGHGVTITPAVGWGLSPDVIFATDEVVTEEASFPARLTTDGITFSITSGPFVGTADELLDQIKKLNKQYLGADTTLSGDRETFSTSSGLTGVGESIANPNNEGIALAFIVGDGEKATGFELVVFGPTGTVSEHVEEIARMIDSLVYTPIVEEKS